jgi:hypothetical protein
MFSFFSRDPDPNKMTRALNTLGGEKGWIYQDRSSIFNTLDTQTIHAPYYVFSLPSDNRDTEGRIASLKKNLFNKGKGLNSERAVTNEAGRRFIKLVVGQKEMSRFYNENRDNRVFLDSQPAAPAPRDVDETNQAASLTGLVVTELADGSAAATQFLDTEPANVRWQNSVEKPQREAVLVVSDGAIVKPRSRTPGRS